MPPGVPGLADADETPYGIPAGQLPEALAGGSKRVLVLMLLIEMCLRWLMPAHQAVASPAAPATVAWPVVASAASQHHIGLAPIHAPPPRLSSSTL